MGLRKPDRDDARDAFGSRRSDMRTPVRNERGRQRGRPYSFNWERARRLEPEDLDRLAASSRPAYP
jgi:hypothetical protein